ncbi:GDP-mannose 4,6-dehydratase [Streptomyces sp. PKU-EA00015]|uniref:NAD-dependent epimerase/dehydratase family protein n=1 Tax=Streptomyces sp. PKU-EA00015 TaxID=2748326 RepID=UPI0015A08083|nr:NAD-dependent epimerase/dehydratase family protein [Streptomyces sp. PKU-EA00015]NWF25737.1 GDP-mannose 4,6-dehydratase [Streptomyces sp. PKU-EA00015]
MRAVVTGAAGFIGSHLCAHLLAAGDEVVGIDAVTDTYDPKLKEHNLDVLRRSDGFDFRLADLLETDLARALDGAEVVYHLAGEPGVRPSWGREFPRYTSRNVLTTQALLEATRGMPLRKLVYASSSSVYGHAADLPTAETLCPRPVSPYGVTKLAAEHLCELYRTAFGVPTVSLRLFTVYGPRQRPDMAFARLVAAAVRDEPFALYGDGEQTRDFTYVADTVTAMRGAAQAEFTGVANIGGGSRASMNEAIAIVECMTGRIDLRRTAAQPGDIRHTGADISVAADAFGFAPEVTLPEGLAEMVAQERFFGGPRHGPGPR